MIDFFSSLLEIHQTKELWLNLNIYILFFCLNKKTFKTMSESNVEQKAAKSWCDSWGNSIILNQKYSKNTVNLAI